jgi:hypothetical protein
MRTEKEVARGDAERKDIFDRINRIYKIKKIKREIP